MITSTGERGSVFTLSQLRDSRLVGIIKGLIAYEGITNAIEFFIPAVDLPNIGDLGGAIGRGLSGQGQGDHPGIVVKTWHNGKDGDPDLATAFFVRLDDGRIGAQRKDGTWTYYRPKKPVGIVYSNGIAGDIRDFERSGKAFVKQAKSIQKTLNAVLPKPPAKRTPRSSNGGDVPYIVKEQGAGDLVVAKR